MNVTYIGQNVHWFRIVLLFGFRALKVHVESFPAQTLHGWHEYQNR